jgi:fimbrial chaperone protein
MALLPLALSLSPPAAAQTDGVQITPVTISMTAERGVTSMRVRNWRDREISFEASLYGWDQANGADILTQTSAIVAAPSVFSIPAGGEQIVRLGLVQRSRDIPEQEVSYRLLLRELPTLDATGGLRVQLHMSLPVFVQPRATHIEIAAQRVADDDSRSGVVITNTGSVHIRLASVTYGPGENALERLPRYLLPGRSITRALPSGVEAIEATYGAPGQTAPITTTLRFDAPPPVPHVR